MNTKGSRYQETNRGGRSGSVTDKKATGNYGQRGLPLSRYPSDYVLWAFFRYL